MERHILMPPTLRRHMGCDAQVLCACVLMLWWSRCDTLPGKVIDPNIFRTLFQGADRMTVERVTRFYLGEFQTTLTKGGKYINQLDPEEEKALIR